MLNTFAAPKSHSGIMKKIIIITFGMIMTTLPVWAIPVDYKLTPTNGGLEGTITLDTDLVNGPFMEWDLTDGNMDWSDLTDVVMINGINGSNHFEPQVRDLGGDILTLDFDITAMDFTADVNGNGHSSGNASPVPEPGTILLLSTGLLALAGYRWLQRRGERSQVG